MKLITEVNGRKVLYENDITRSVGLVASCNCCDRIIYEDEMTSEQFTESLGYCPECTSEQDEENKN